MVWTVESTPEHCDNVYLALACRVAISEESDLHFIHCMALVPAGSTQGSPPTPFSESMPGKEGCIPGRYNRGIDL